MTVRSSMKYVKINGYFFKRCLIGIAVIILLAVCIQEKARAGDDRIPELIKDARNGSVVTQYHLGMIYQFGDKSVRNFKKAVYWMRQAATNGSLDAMDHMARFYRDGKIGKKVNLKKAFYWSHKSAIKGSRLGQFYVGVAYDQGKIVKTNYKRALYWYKKAAAQDETTSMNNIGSHYSRGLGVKKNDRTALYWYKLAIKNGAELTGYNAGRYYEFGMGVKVDYKKAIYYYSLAAKAGHLKAKVKLKALKLKIENISRLKKLTVIFRKNIKPGDQSHCGLVITVKSPITKVQTMKGEHWFKVNQLFPEGAHRCRFMNGQYIP